MHIEFFFYLCAVVVKSATVFLCIEQKNKFLIMSNWSLVVSPPSSALDCAGYLYGVYHLLNEIHDMCKTYSPYQIDLACRRIHNVQEYVYWLVPVL